MKTLEEIADRARPEALKKISRDRKYLQENKNLIFSIYPDGRILTAYLSSEYYMETEVLCHLLLKGIQKRSTEEDMQESQVTDSLSSSFDSTPTEQFNPKKTDIMNLKNALAKIAETIKKETLEKILPDRKLMEDLKNDETITTKEEKDKILDYYINRGWGLEDAIRTRLENRFYKEEKVKLVMEFFPDFKIKEDE